jgi:hypothetical protein
MADSKITALTSISTSTDPAVDPLVIVDVSDTSMAATGTTKKVTLNNLLSSSPTATGAFSVTGLVTAGSASITGAATVGTTLGVTGASTLASVGVTGAATVGTTLAVTGNLTAAADSILGTGSKATDTLLDFKADTGTQRIYLDRGGRNLIFKDVTTNIENYRITGVTGVHTWGVGGSTAMTLNSTGLGIGVTPANNKLQVLGNIGLPNVCMASGETNGEFSIDVANLFAQTGAVWRQCSLLLVYSGVDVNLGNSTVLQTIITLQGLATWNTISKNDVVGVASVAVSLDTTTSARITVTVPAGNFGSAYVMLLGGVGPTTRLR